jgi:hypothetical protein
LRRKITTTIYITPEQNDLLKALHERTRVPIAEFIRQGIDLILEKNQSVLPRQLTLYEAIEAVNGKKNG